MANRRRLDDTRDHILDAGAQILEEQGFTIGTGNVSLIDACRRAGLRTAGSGYKLWSTQEEFRFDVLRHLFESVDTSLMLSGDLLEALEESGPETGLVELIRVGSNERARVVAESSAFTRAVALWLAAANDPELQDQYRAALHKSVVLVADLYRDLLDHYDRKVLEPFTVEMFALAVVAQAAGLGLHDSIVGDVGADDIERSTGPEGAMQRWHLLGCVTDALSRTFTAPKNPVEGVVSPRG